MDIICKCGHKAFHHEDFKRVGKKFQCLEWPCNCQLTEREVYEIHITEQQARLDTNRAQVTALIAERDALKNQLRGWLSGLDCWADEKGISDLDDMMEEMQEALS